MVFVVLNAVEEEGGDREDYEVKPIFKRKFNYEAEHERVRGMGLDGMSTCGVLICRYAEAGIVVGVGVHRLVNLNSGSGGCIPELTAMGGVCVLGLTLKSQK